jgi:ribokinase
LEIIPAPKVEAVDTTAAGDTFNGALTVALSEGRSIQESIIFANKAASISVTRLGAQSSVPFRKEILI